MNRTQAPVAIRTTAAALAVFMTVATLSSLVTVAGPQQSALIAQTAVPRHADVVAQAPTSEADH